MGQLFVAKTTEYKELRASKEPQEILILDQRRAYQIKIMLGGMKLTYPEIRQAILRMDEDFMTLVQLSNLLKFVPDAEEIGKLLEYKDASEDVKLTLGRPEAFFVEMLKVGRYQRRLEGLKFKVTFQGMLEGVNEGISSITEASKGLKNTKHFKELLSLILMLRNSMNGASHNGGAFGFKIASINKLVDTKASNAPNMTLLHFLTSITETTLPDVLNYQQEIAACGTACRVSLPDLQTDFNHLKTKIKELKTELHTHYFNGWKCSPEDRFYEVMQPFMATVEMEAQYKEVVKFYGEDCRDETRRTFTASFEKAREDNQKQKEKELWREKAKTAAKARQEQMAAKKNRINVQGGGSHDAEGGGDDKEMMDNLLETLRNEGDNDASRRDRRRKNRVDHTPANVTVKAQGLLTSLREDRQHIPLLHE
ncbi:Dishevelled associated activator of morphoproteinsis 2 [Mortierella sp. AD031]|nr:Dishevelled associated activator of morphoproteinsis 2 [Mortierella sp. AD031]